MRKIKYSNKKLQLYFSDVKKTPYYFVIFILAFILFVSCVFKFGFSVFNNVFENQLLSIILILSVIFIIISLFFKKFFQRKIDLIIGVESLVFVSIFEIYFFIVLTNSYTSLCIVFIGCLLIKIFVFLSVELSMYYSIQKNKKACQLGVVLTIPIFFIVRFFKNTLSLKSGFLIFGCIVILVFNLMYYFIVRYRLLKQLDNQDNQERQSRDG